jgi:hypothetical protein
MMATPSERVRKLVDEGRVDSEEGQRLLGALAVPGAAGRAASDPRGARLLVDPFERWGGGAAALAGLVFVILGFALSRLGIRFDGFLDLHVSAVTSAVKIGVVEQLVAWPLGALCLWLVARIVGASGARFLDFLGAVGVARGPLVLFAIPIQLLAPASVPTRMSPMLLGIAVIALTCIAWQIALLFFGYRNASGLRGPKVGFSFVGALFAAEIASKVALYFFAL